MGIAHLAFNLGTGHHRRNRVNDNRINRTRAHKRLTDFHRLLAVVRLADQQAVNVHAERTGIHRVKRVLDIDEGNFAALLLGFCQHMQRKRCLA